MTYLSSRQDPFGASKRLCIDEDNTDALIFNNCQDWVKVLKQEQESKVDWKCNDIENSEDKE